MNEEKLFSVDSKDRPVKSKFRKLAVRQALWRRASGGLIIDASKSLVLCHRRSYLKDERPGVWVCTFGGKVQEKESCDAAAKREFFEEFGINALDIDIVSHGKWKSRDRRQFEYLFFFFLTSEDHDIVHDPDEVAEFKWLSFKDVLKNLDSHQSWFSYGYEEEMISVSEVAWQAMQTTKKNKNSTHTS